MTAHQCPAWYDRPSGAKIQCTYITEHESPRHSWQTLKDQDEAERETAKTDYTPVAIQSVIDGLLDGTLDEYLEAILAAGHARKRMRRRGWERTTVEVQR